jgi:hypothetical protein
MASILQELLAAGLIDKVEGDDGRLEKIEKAVIAVAEALKKERPKLIAAILAALDDGASDSDPAIRLAETALIDEWKTVLSVHPDKPVHIYRSILFAACAAVAQGENAAILWLTAADTLPFCQLGAEAEAVRRLVASFAETAEEQAVAGLSPSPRRKKTPEPLILPESEIEPYTIDREEFVPKLTAAVQNVQVAHHSPQGFINSFTGQMKELLGDLTDGLAENVEHNQKGLEKSLREYLSSFSQSVQESMALATSFATKEQLKIDALWWYESLYSLSSRKSYREISPFAAVVLMPLDLISLTPVLSPSAVGYVLSEAVARLPNMGYERTLPLSEIIVEVSAAKGELAPSRISEFVEPLSLTGRLSLRDVVRFSLNDAPDFTGLLKRARIPNDAKISLPHLARVILRQEQAIRLATGKK